MNQRGGGDIVRLFAQPALLNTLVCDMWHGGFGFGGGAGRHFTSSHFSTRLVCHAWAPPSHLSLRLAWHWLPSLVFGKCLHNTTVCRAKMNCLLGQTEPLAENKINLKKPISFRSAFSIGKLSESITVRFIYQQNHYISCNYTGVRFGDRPMLRKM